MLWLSMLLILPAFFTIDEQAQIKDPDFHVDGDRMAGREICQPRHELGISAPRPKSKQRCPARAPVLSKLLTALEEGDVLMTFRLDRLGRSLVHLVKVLENLEARAHYAHSAYFQKMPSAPLCLL